MRLRAARPLAVALCVAGCVSGCSSDDDAATTTTSAARSTTTVATAPDVPAAGTPVDQQRQAIVAKILADSGEHGYTLDEECLTALVAGLSTTDVSILATSATDPSGSSPTSGLSPQAEAMDVLSCSAGSTDAGLVAEAAGVAIAAVSEGTTQRFDRSCVETAFAKLGDDQLQAVVTAGPKPQQEDLQPVLYLMIPCLLDGATATSGS